MAKAEEPWTQLATRIPKELHRQLLDPGDEPRQRLRRRLTTEHSATKQLGDLG